MEEAQVVSSRSDKGNDKGKWERVRGKGAGTRVRERARARARARVRETVCELGVKEGE